jgi:hypothetical protein
MALCTVCKALPFADILQNPEPEYNRIKSYRPSRDPGRSHHATMEAITLAANEGCPLCSRVLVRLRLESRGTHFPLRVYAIGRKLQDPAASAWCAGAETAANRSAAVGTPGIEFAETYRSGNHRYHWTLPFYVAPVVGPPGPLITRSVPWPTVEDAAKEWLRFCGEKYPRCLPLSDRPLPTRVIDLGDKDSSRVHLVESHGLLGRYVALSHCWGDREPTTTTSDNYVSHKNEGIAICDLPQTFRDAIEVVRALGFQYLWIDCLCIIQQDGEDWRREAPRMLEVYANAVVTVASCVQDAFVGFLKESSWAPHTAVCQINLQWENENSATTVAFLEESEQRPWDEHFFKRFERRAWHEHFYPEDGQPWFSRAWTFQERLLSARILYFANGKLFYECSTARFSRSCNSPLPLESLHKDSTIVTKTSLQELDAHALMGMWYRFVADYSRRHLTQGQDRFAAISGVARIIAERSGSEYRAGLWASEFAYGLLWNSSYPIKELLPFKEKYSYRSVSRYKAEYPGPSWSWASCDHGVAYPDDAPRNACMAWSEWAGSVEKIGPDVLALCCELLSTDIQPLHGVKGSIGKEVFGSIEKGSLSLVSAARGIDIACGSVVKPTDPPNWTGLGNFTRDVRGHIPSRFETNDGVELPVEPVLIGVPVAVWRKRSSDDKDPREKRDNKEVDNDKEVDYENAVDGNDAGIADNNWQLGFFAWVLERDRSDIATYRRVGSIKGRSLDDLQWLLGGVRERLVVL